MEISCQASEDPSYIFLKTESTTIGSQWAGWTGSPTTPVSPGAMGSLGCPCSGCGHGSSVMQLKDAASMSSGSRATWANRQCGDFSGLVEFIDENMDILPTEDERIEDTAEATHAPSAELPSRQHASPTPLPRTMAVPMAATGQRISWWAMSCQLPAQDQTGGARWWSHALGQCHASMMSPHPRAGVWGGENR